ncbi:LysR family transcriptional regulator [Niallia nealsonii]|uniref:LysR family transcriptional regulator n=1 Tax=Niallia nealsonii TaxID=115979 RepID=A0A2N0Z0Y3_9BACI|nr:LysR family transcriptional regulator [Niallia nealsonii]PKG23158.1 LysR family transcriptional regulator [Niallia nealsonii]
MDFRQLKYFATIVENDNNVTKAARALNISQPPLSQQLKTLENQLGAKLFERQGKKLNLTLSGKLLYKKAVKLLELFDDTITEVRDVEMGIKGELSIGVAGFYSYILPEKIKQFHEMYPNITFRIVQGDANLLHSLLEKGEIDVAIVNLPTEINQNKISILPLNTFGFSLFIAKDSEWVQQKEVIYVQQLENIPLVLTKREGTGGTYHSIIEEFHQCNITPNIITECNDMQIVFSLVDAGIGATIMPDYMLDFLNISTIRSLKIVDSSLTNQIAVLWNKYKYTPKLLNEFIQLFKDDV